MNVIQPTLEAEQKKRAEEHALELFTSGKDYVEVVQALVAKGLSGPDSREIAAQVEINNARQISRFWLKWMFIGGVLFWTAIGLTHFGKMSARSTGGGTYFEFSPGFGFAISLGSLIMWVKYRFMKKKRQY
jgi:hypothetical protein